MRLKRSTQLGLNILTKPHFLRWNFFSKVSRKFCVDFTNTFKVQVNHGSKTQKKISARRPMVGPFWKWWSWVLKYFSSYRWVFERLFWVFETIPSDFLSKNSQNWQIWKGYLLCFFIEKQPTLTNLKRVPLCFIKKTAKIDKFEKRIRSQHRAVGLENSWSARDWVYK